MPTPQSLSEDHGNACADALRKPYLVRRDSVIRYYPFADIMARRVLHRAPTNLFIAIVAQAYANTTKPE